ncbi:MAG: LON peptidase substrate-binding domain-containing protein [Mycobacteriales bacterium]
MPTLPLFPLGTVLFPGVVMPLHVFEPRYQQLIADLRSGARQRFGVVAIRRGGEVGEGAATDLYPMGCAAEVRRISDRPDGSHDVITVGIERFRLESLVASDSPYLVGEVSYLPDPAEEDARPLAGLVADAFLAYLTAMTEVRGGDDALPDLPEDPRVLSYLVATTALLELNDRHELLACPSVGRRLAAELRLLRRETGFLRGIKAVPVPLRELQVPPGPN